MWGETALIILIIIGIIGKAPLIATSACILMVIKLSHLTHYFPLIERRGLEIGLLFLMLSVLTPLAKGKFSVDELKGGLFSWAGLFALLGGVLATHLNDEGLNLLKKLSRIITWFNYRVNYWYRLFWWYSGRSSDGGRFGCLFFKNIKLF